MADKIKNPHAPVKMFNLSKISDLTDIKKDKLYVNMKGDRDTLTDEEKEKVFQILDDSMDELRKIVFRKDEK